MQMNEFGDWLISEDVWQAFSHCGGISVLRFLEDVKSGGVGLGIKGVFSFNYQFLAQVNENLRNIPGKFLKNQ